MHQIADPEEMTPVELLQDIASLLARGFLRLAATLRQPSHILVQEEGKYWRVMQHRFDGSELPHIEVAQEVEYADVPWVEEEAPF